MEKRYYIDGKCVLSYDDDVFSTDDDYTNIKELFIYPAVDKVYVKYYEKQLVQQVLEKTLKKNDSIFNTYCAIKELIKDERKEDVLVANLLNPRNEEYIISSKDKYQNPYDSFDLNQDFDVSFKDANDYEYKYLDVEISMKMTNEKIVKYIEIHRNNETEDLSNLEEYSIDIYKLEYEGKVILHFINIDINYFKNKEEINQLLILYHYSSLFNTSWSNNILDIKIKYRK